MTAAANSARWATKPLCREARVLPTKGWAWTLKHSKGTGGGEGLLSDIRRVSAVTSGEGVALGTWWWRGRRG